MTRFRDAYEHSQRVHGEREVQRQTDAAQELLTQNRETFSELFSEGFGNIPKGFQFSVDSPDMSSVSVFPTLNGGKSLIMDVQGQATRGRRQVAVHDTYYINAEGRVTPPVTKQLPGVNPQELFRLVLSRCKEVAISKWRNTDLELNPEGSGGAPQTVVQNVESKSFIPVIELARIALLAKQEGIVARVVNRLQGFSGYRLYVFSTFCVMECDFTGNAAYVIDFDGPIPETTERIGRMSDAELNGWIESIPGGEAIRMPRSQKRAQNNVLRITHNGDWQDRLKTAIALRQYSASLSGTPANQQAA